MKIYCEPLMRKVELSNRIERIVSLVSGFTETIFEMGHGSRVVGVSKYCARYVRNLNAEVVGDYLNVDLSKLRSLEPDLILLTTGVQMKLALDLVREGFPVFVLPLPRSINGVWENVVLLGGLLNDVEAARRLVMEWQKVFLEGCETHRDKPSAYVELWFGRHLRTVGAMSFVNDVVEYAGLKNIFSSVNEAFFIPPLDEVSSQRPRFVIFFHEPEYPVDPRELIASRGWNWDMKLIESTVEAGKNLIHDGPSMMRTVRWLREQIWR
ncbi:helical backbone metal receptor [Thermotoga caldifontis]|uniref:helical backbone metal receptor n=1 Tax=Thermotoga caldifontis TaxID=1508419 RepID=UPI000693B912|nr:helical backbone metal receptor [Thermotoga caldifontis]